MAELPGLQPCQHLQMYSNWSQRRHSCTFKNLIIHQDEAKQLVRWAAKFFPCNSLQTQKTLGYQISLTRSEWPAFSVYAISQNASCIPAYPFLLTAARQSSNCRSFLCLKSFQLKLQRPSTNRHWLKFSFWYEAAFSSETKVPAAFGIKYTLLWNAILLLPGQAHKLYC